jgi:hypothetical protein
LIGSFLLAVFFIPQAIQNHHVLTVQHYISHCEHSCQTSGEHLQKATEHCPIHDFVFSVPDSLVKNLKITQPTVFSQKIYFFQKQTFVDTVFYSYFLRAPPVFL